VELNAALQIAAVIKTVLVSVRRACKGYFWFLKNGFFKETSVVAVRLIVVREAVLLNRFIGQPALSARA
jgi:hypothetical protein